MSYLPTIAEILQKKYPGTIWTVTERDYNSLMWYEENTLPKPTQEELFQYDEEVSLEVRWDKVRNTRNRLLTICDWTQVLDSPLSQEKKQEWQTYRQQLRDITNTFPTPEDVVYPTQPS